MAFDDGTRTAISMVRMLSEKVTKVQKCLWLCFIGCAKESVKVKHKELLEMLRKHALHGNYGQIIHNLKLATAFMQIENEYTKLERGGNKDFFLPGLFNLYSELKGLQGILFSGCNVDNICYADENVLMADSEGKLKELLYKIVKENKKKWLYILYSNTLLSFWKISFIR